MCCIVSDWLWNISQLKQQISEALRWSYKEEKGHREIHQMQKIQDKRIMTKSYDQIGQLLEKDFIDLV